MIKNRDLASWLGLTSAGLIASLSSVAIIAMFWVHRPGFDILMAVTAITLSLSACSMGIKHDSRVSNFTNKANLIGYLFHVVLTALLIFFHYFILPSVSSSMPTKAYYISASSMSPTLQPGDRVLTDRRAYRSHRPQREDIVVIRLTGEQSIQARLRVQFSRVIGLPGETVAVINGKVFINQKPLQEPYILEPPTYQYGPALVPANSYFVLGDNRNESYYDSHSWGFVSQANLLSKVNLIYLPLNRYGSPTKSRRVNQI